jgi:hypothetical protein
LDVNLGIRWQLPAGCYAVYAVAKPPIGSLIVLDDSGKTDALDEKEESIEVSSSLLYQIRSDFIHRDELILEFDTPTVLLVRSGRPIDGPIELNHLCKIFESGLLQHFGIIADKKQI